MEELRRISIKYYQNTVRIRFFGIRGAIYLMSTFPILTFSFYLHFSAKHETLSILSILICALFWVLATNEYNRNLLRHLSFYTHSGSQSVATHKALYLQELTSHIAPTIFESLKILKKIVEIERTNKSFVLNNFGHHLSKFLYDPESKSRVISLAIYLISLIAILMVIKPQYDFNLFMLIDSIQYETVKTYLLLSLFIIIFGYFVAVLPIMFATTYIVVPILLRLSNNTTLTNHFISEMNKYSFLDGIRD